MIVSTDPGMEQDVELATQAQLVEAVRESLTERITPEVAAAGSAAASA